MAMASGETPSVLTLDQLAVAAVRAMRTDHEGVSDEMVPVVFSPLYQPIRDALGLVADTKHTETRVTALAEACFIAAEVGELAERMTSPFKEGAETAVEEIIHRLMKAGAPKLADSADSRAIRKRFKEYLATADRSAKRDAHDDADGTA